MTRAALILSPLLLLAACQGNREWKVRVAVKKVVIDSPDHDRASDRLVAFGTYALPEIEQQLQSAPAAARLRLVEVVRRIGSSEGLPLMRMLARWDDDQKVRRAAKRAVATLQ